MISKLAKAAVATFTTVSPPAADHIAAIRRLIERGATHVMVHSPQHDQRKVIEFYGREVLPALR